MLSDALTRPSCLRWWPLLLAVLGYGVAVLSVGPAVAHTYFPSVWNGLAYAGCLLLVLLLEGAAGWLACRAWKRRLWPWMQGVALVLSVPLMLLALWGLVLHLLGCLF